MEEYNPIDWGNIDGVKSEIDVHQEWLILQNNIRKKKKRHRYLLLFWPFLFCAMMAIYLFNTSNKENVLVSQSKITSEQKDSKQMKKEVYFLQIMKIMNKVLNLLRIQVKNKNTLYWGVLNPTQIS